MRQRILSTLVFMVLLGPAGLLAQDGPDAYWAFDEGGGNGVLDSSGNGHDGTIMGNFQWVPGVFGSALQFSGVSGERIEVTGYDGVLGTSDRTVALWINTTGLGDIISWGINTNTLKWIFRVQTGNGVTGAIRTEASGGYIVASTDVRDGEWHHVASVLESNGAPTILDVTMYLDGVEEAISASQSVAVDTTSRDVWIGDGHHDRPFPGAMDDLAIFSRALSQEEIVELMSGLGQRELASKPSPENEASDVLRDTVLSWASGVFAESHNIYFGMVFDDVNDADVANPRDVLVQQNYVDNMLDVGRLEFDQTYYWRVDEVNGAPDRTVFKGKVWRFGVEPFSIPVANVTATASGSFSESTADKTVDGSGLAGDLHSTVVNDMWLSDSIPAWIQFDLGRSYKLDEMWVWNSNQTIETFLGFGAKDVAIETSVDGESWHALDGVAPLAKASGLEGYAANSMIDLAGRTARHVRMTINSVHGFAPQASLSEVRIFYIPTFASRPEPASGSNDISPDTTLSWGRDGREADRHEVYLGTEADALSLAGTVMESRFGTQSSDLQLGQTYYWQVTEVNDAMDPSAWAGDIWHFSTVQQIVVDDMEGYADQEFKEIWATWVDGFDDPANGALVGNGAAGTPETGRVHGGAQSLPLHYDNGAATQSAALRTFADSQDWAAHGIKSLVVHFEGSATNTGGTLFVRINDTRVGYDGDASNLMRAGWNKWVIVLADVAGTDLSRVGSLAIGVDGGGEGILYVDDIYLSAEIRDLITPTEPVEGLALYLPLDGDFQDASGNGRHGAAMGAPAFEAGATGQALSLNGIDQFVEVTGYKGITAIDQVQQAFTVSNWFKTFENGEMVTWGAAPGGERLSWRIDGGSLRTEHGNGNLRGNTVVSDGEWHHGALVVQEGASLRVPATLLYIDGIEDSVFSGDDDAYNLQPDTDVRVGSRATSNDRFFPGAIDEVRIYDRALSAGEVAWLAGRTAAFDRP